MKITRRLIVALFAGALTLGVASPAFGWDCEHEKAKCNSGRGNQSETTPENDCDPGNSGGHNNGGD